MYIPFPAHPAPQPDIAAKARRRARRVAGGGVLRLRTVLAVGALAGSITAFGQGSGDGPGAMTPAPIAPDQIFFGHYGDAGSYALDVQPNGDAVLLGNLPDGTGGFCNKFHLDPAGTFSISVSRPSVLSLQSADVAADNTNSGERFSGQVADGHFTGVYRATGESLQSDAEPASGATARVSGYYESSVLNSSTGSTVSIVGTQGSVLVMTTSGLGTGAALGSISPEGTFTASLASDMTVTGRVDSDSGVIAGTIALPDMIPNTFVGTAVTAPRTDRLLAISARGRVGQAGDGSTLITGFIVSGSTPHDFIVRGVGPGLAQFGLGAFLPRPRISLFDAAGNLLQQNDGWDSTPDTAASFAAVGLFPLDLGSADAALPVTLAPGAYTVRIDGQGGNGIALGEIYAVKGASEADPTPMVALSTRGQVNGDSDILIGGFAISGTVSKKVLIRGAGPMLARYGVSGVLTQPVLAVYDASGQLIGRNDQWESPSPVNSTQVSASATDLAAAAQRAGAAPFDPGSRDAALVITLAPGSYTAQVSAADGQPGVALVEIYELPDL